MKLFELDTYIKHSKIVALIAIAIAIIAWIMDIGGMVYECPYCRVQRSVIGILGLILILPISFHWIGKYAALVIGFFGAVVAANQHFMGWKKVSAGEFQLNLPVDPFILSGLALTMIMGLIYIIMVKKR
ncbi:MAG: disulfide bond formation protein B [Colwellia sp.]|uniref:disulfide bond formation protein B n=1 Tax=Colwellia sp. TaxID=56799 RepID=UPI001E08BC9F|nr:disulfide bond formation protein B [Colwellia sp.]NQY50296.1 disulfide bond formation protein B [Colwellia sp.]